MFKSLASTVVGGALLVCAATTSASATTYQQRMVVNQVTITISCFRGPFSDVIWDHPNGIFIDDLVNIGYTFPEAHAIAERVCRDAATVDRPDVAIDVMYRIIAENPPGQ